MRIDKRFLIVISASLLWALVVAAGFYRWTSGAGRRANAAGREKLLVVASQMLPMGATLDSGMLKRRSVPERLFPAGGFSRLEDVLGRSVTSPIQPDEAIVEARIAARGSGIGVAPLIPPGMRAISVRVNDVVGVAGFVLPGMRVDVLVTGNLPNGGAMSRTILENIAVLSAGQILQPDAKNNAITAPVVTLLVTPAEAEVLTLANTEGHLQLVLRNATDRQLATTQGYRIQQLYNESTPIAISPAKPASSAKPRKLSAAPPPIAVSTPVAPSPVSHQALREPEPPAGVVLIRGTVKTIEHPIAVKGGSEK
jgi:pilus assembly protein CpaB